MEFLPSPNFNARRIGAKIQHLILHYTGKHSTEEFISHMLEPERQLSAHYIIDYDGKIFQLVDEAQRAWHAGKSFWAGETDINSTSIGIEISNPGHDFGYVSFQSAQIPVLINLCRDIITRYNILPQHVLGHSDISIGRKFDPGELFPWALLAQNGVGLFPPHPNPERDAFSPQGEREQYVSFEQNRSPAPGGRGQAVPDHWSGTKPGGGGNKAEELATYGYDISNLPAAITAFQRHFRPEKINGEWDAECGARLAALLAAIKGR